MSNANLPIAMTSAVENTARPKLTASRAIRDERRPDGVTERRRRTPCSREPARTLDTLQRDQRQREHHRRRREVLDEPDSSQVIGRF
jgi:hypothetical protein